MESRCGKVQSLGWNDDGLDKRVGIRKRQWWRGVSGMDSNGSRFVLGLRFWLF